MRTLKTLQVGLVLIFVLVLGTAAAFAETFREQTNQQTSLQSRDFLREIRGATTLKLPPQFLEIYRINEAAVAEEGRLLKLLAASQDEEVVQQLVFRLSRLNADREIDILKVRINYAQIGGRYALVFELRREMVELLTRQMGQPM